jgi:hypothetical protein
MPLQKLPTVDLDNVNHRKRARETLNNVLDHSFDDSKAQTAAEKIAGITPVNKAYSPLNLFRYMTPEQISDVQAGTLSQDISGAFSKLVTVLAQNPGGQATIPPGQYFFASSPTISGEFAGSSSFWCYGAEFYTADTAGSLVGLSISFTFTPHQLSIYGLKINHRGNGNVDAGFDLSHCANIRLKDCTVEAHGTESGYAAFQLRNSTPSDPDTGCFWTTIETCTVRKRSGSDPGDIDVGIRVQGAANATKIIRCNIGGIVTTGVLVIPETGQTYIANGLLIDSCDFETGTDAIVVNGAAASPIGGLKVVNCRCEAFTTFITLAGSTSQPVVTPYFAGNYCTPDIVTWLSNGNNLWVRDFDDCSNSGFAPTWDASGPLALSNRSGVGGNAALSLRPFANGQGATLLNPSGSACGKWAVTTGTEMQIGSSSASQFNLYGIKSMSATGTLANNFVGSDAFVTTSLTRTVTFATAESDASYRVYITPTSDWGAQTKAPWVTGKGTSGFTVNVQATTSGGTFDWLIIRN